MSASADISEQSGKRRFFASFVLAVLLGLIVRSLISPVRTEQRLRSELEKSEFRDQLKFGSAEVSLASGWWPDLAIVLNRVEWRPSPSCVEGSPVRARSVRMPLRMVSLLRGEPSVGKVKIDELVVDIDALKAATSKTCETETRVASGPTGVRTGGAVSKAEVKYSPSEIWSETERARWASMVSGVDVTRAEIYFEKRMKSIVIEDFSARWRGSSLDVQTVLKFPPATVFGENLPSFNVSGVISRDEIRSEIRADLSEGILEAIAEWKPVVSTTGQRELDSNIRMSVSDLPLSVVTPLFVKSGFFDQRFKPRFAWLDCNAEVSGIFSRLLLAYPVTLSSCEVSGKLGSLKMSEAVREPNGDWRPFSVDIDKLDIGQVLETFDIRGLTGVFSSFGVLSGRIKSELKDMTEIRASWSGAVVRFAGAEGVALQPISVKDVVAENVRGAWRVKLADFEVTGGRSDATVNVAIGSNSSEIGFEIKSLRLGPRVEQVLFSGTVAEMSGTGSVVLRATDSSIEKVAGKFVLKGLQGGEVDASEILVETKNLAKNGTTNKFEIELTARSVGLEVARGSRIFRLLEPALLGWTQPFARDGQRLMLGSVALKGLFRDDGFQWTDARAGLGSKVVLISRGRISRDQSIEAELTAQFPLEPRLKWAVKGTWFKPEASVASAELVRLLSKAGLAEGAISGVVPPRLLGVE